MLCDMRYELPDGAYAAHPIPMVMEPSGDCWARAMVRIREMDESLEWILRVAETMSDVAADTGVELTPRAGHTAVSVEEGWRGELVHVIETDAAGRIAHYKLQDPSLRNWFGLAMAVRGNDISDFPICNKSFDLSYCGHDL
jgi:Ni,Fe-hydrogenase III large subunit